ncbi:MAG: hypothetical protein KF869_14085 [Phycisphaeraceae bacterium]|nr:hypothetical protein [Phycisphaeraceae bacterium]
MARRRAAAAAGNTRHDDAHRRGWRADVSAIFDNRWGAGAVIEWQEYSAYGVPFLLTHGDHNKDGVVNSADEDAFDEDYTVHGPRSKQRDPWHVKAEERRRPCHHL